MFADTVLSIYKKDDLVWIHDYHLMLVPSMLRAVKPRMKIGFFLHIPFPSSGKQGDLLENSDFFFLCVVYALCVTH